jgi:hypothetical protein
MAERGKIVEISIGKAITFNEEVYTKATIEIDHVNYGLNLETKELNRKKRSGFTAEHVCQFLLEIDGMDISPAKVSDDFSYFSLELLCPVKGTHFDKKFRIVFTTTVNDPGAIGTITLYRVK